jgi:enoyl-CoA hydratase/carnithine racemase
MGEPVLTVEDLGAVRRLRLNRPAKLNALDAALVDALTAALSTAERDPGVHVVLLSGQGRAFCAGVDTGSFARLADEAAIRTHAQRLAGAFDAAVGSSKPLVAAVQGYALGAGCGLVAASDLAVAERDCVLGYPEATRGLLPALVVPTLLHSVGAKRAFELLASGRRIAARDAADLGLVSQVVDGDADGAALAVAQQLAATDPELLARLKGLLRDCAGRSPEAGLAMAAEANVAHRLDVAGRGTA